MPRSKERTEQLRNRSAEEIRKEQHKKYGEDLAEARKSCSKCKDKKPLGDFGPNKDLIDGLQSQCRTCQLETQRALWAKRKQRSEDEIKQTQAKRLKTSDGALVQWCFVCKQEKRLDEFYKNVVAELGIDRRCKSCFGDYGAERYQDVKEFRNELKVDQFCENCGESAPEVLDFAHIDREEKYRTKSGRTYGISQMNSIALIEEEAAKTKWLCAFCHRLETAQENREIAAQRSAEDRQRTWAKAVQNRQFVNLAKMAAKTCQDCKRLVTEDTCCAFDFDHVDERTKQANVSSMLGAPLDEIQAEIAKCQLRCVNCHRKRTNKRRTQKALLSHLEDLFDQYEAIRKRHAQEQSDLLRSIQDCFRDVESP